MCVQELGFGSKVAHSSGWFTWTRLHARNAKSSPFVAGDQARKMHPPQISPIFSSQDRRAFLHPMSYLNVPRSTSRTTSSIESILSLDWADYLKDFVFPTKTWHAILLNYTFLSLLCTKISLILMTSARQSAPLAQRQDFTNTWCVSTRIFVF